MAPLMNGDKILIKVFCLEKGCSAVQMMCEFLARNSPSRSTGMLCDLIKCINTTGSIDRKKG